MLFGLYSLLYLAAILSAEVLTKAEALATAAALLGPP
jgi:hypothetical protein